MTPLVAPRTTRAYCPSWLPEAFVLVLGHGLAAYQAQQVLELGGLQIGHQRGTLQRVADSALLTCCKMDISK